MSKLTITIENKGTEHNCPQTLTLEYRDVITLTEALEAFTLGLTCLGFNYPNHTLAYEAPENGDDSNT